MVIISIYLQGREPSPTLEIIDHYACKTPEAGGRVIYSIESPSSPVKRAGYLCLLIKNNSSAVLGLSDLSITVITYNLAGIHGMDELPDIENIELSNIEIPVILPLDSGVKLIDKTGKKVYCTFVDIIDGRCGKKRSIFPNETFEISFTGKFKDKNGTIVDFTYENAKENRMTINLKLPTGFKVSQQITD